MNATLLDKSGQQTLHGSGRRHRTYAASCSVAVLLLPFVAGLGCGSSDYQIVPVSGTITLDGKPLEGALINTQPMGIDNNPNPGPGSFAKTDAEGKFQLELVYPATPGAVVGTHRVRISKLTVKYVAGKEDAPIAIRNPLPRKASDGSIQLTVPSDGVEDAHFDLVTKK